MSSGGLNFSFATLGVSSGELKFLFVTLGVSSGKERKGKVSGLSSVTGFSSKLVFNLAEHPTLL